MTDLLGDSTRQWTEDLLGRKQYADFLTKFVDEKCRPGKSGLVIAVDAPWGLGKTFFIQHWAEDLERAGRAVVAFDAWKNDSSDEATLSFMSALRQQLAPLYARASKPTDADRLRRKSREVVGNLRKATMPALGVVGKAVLKKATGVAFDELVSAASARESEEELFGELAESAPAALEKGLDAFFEKALKAHSDKMKSVEGFRRSLEELVALLQDGGISDGPLYVFIDELDRCRPDFAIRLLEGIKHLFSVRGVAFVVSTNLDQLGKAVGAVYGPAFNGFHYLKRFFDFEYELPQPPREAFIQVKLQQTSLQKLDMSGLDEELAPERRSTEAAFASVADAFGLDLRAVERVLTIADVAVAGAPSGTCFVALWIAFLAALKHVYPSEFRAVADGTLRSGDFERMCTRLFTRPGQLPCIERSDRGPVGREATASLSTALAIFYEATITTGEDLIALMRNDDHWTAPYPNVIRHYLLRGWRGLPLRSPHPIACHAQLIQAAGYVAP